MPEQPSSSPADVQELTGARSAARARLAAEATRIDADAIAEVHATLETSDADTGLDEAVAALNRYLPEGMKLNAVDTNAAAAYREDLHAAPALVEEYETIERTIGAIEDEHEGDEAEQRMAAIGIELNALARKLGGTPSERGAAQEQQPWWKRLLAQSIRRT